MIESTIQTCDLLVIGGGINGCGIARDAAGRGLSVILCEQDDLGAHTSSASSKLIHGGLRYLQYGELGLVRKALAEREVLMRSAPHLIKPLRFNLPHLPGLRPAWLLRFGLFLYDHLAPRHLLPASGAIKLRHEMVGKSLADDLLHGFFYSDAAVDDSRLVILNAMDARERGACILPRTRCVALFTRDSRWHARLETAEGRILKVQAACVVNATGAWTLDLLRQAQLPSARQLRMVKGSHIVVSKLFDHDQAYIFQHHDGRIVFALPFEEDYTLLGTTDVEYRDDPRSVTISSEEVSYLCSISNRYFRRQIAPSDVVWSYAGIRPLLEDGSGNAQAVTRDYELQLDNYEAPMLSVFGGKITTYRKLAEDAMARLSQVIPVSGGAWTAHSCLPGGDLLGATPSNAAARYFYAFVGKVLQRYPWLPEKLAQRYARMYGTRLYRMLGDCKEMCDLGSALMPGLYEQELRYLVDQEWACSAYDVLWRRSKLGLQASKGAYRLIDAWIQRYQRLGHTMARGWQHG